jgi:single-strand DNA-binding protein
VNRVWSNDAGEKQEETTFVDVELWGRQAEIAGEYLRKGRPVFIEGRLKLDSWDDKQTGAKRSKMKVVGEQLQLLGSREGGAGGGSADSGESRVRAPAKATPPPARPASDPDLDAGEDDIPF